MRTKRERTGVGVNGARDRRAIAVLDAKRPALLLASRRRRRIVGILGATRRARARRGWDPEVGRAGIEVDEEALAGRADRDRACPLLVIVLVREGLALTLRQAIGQ